MDSAYDDAGLVAGRVKAGAHREVIGGMWDVIGRLQFEFLLARGLQPEHRLVDIGCGALRGGVHFVRHLRPGHYYGLDNNQSLLDAGYGIELAQAGLQDRLPRGNLFCNADFQLPVEDGFFDVGIAQSVFSHMSFNSIRRCLATIAPKFRAGGMFYATFFSLPDGVPGIDGHAQGEGGVVTFGHQDPYHYRVDDIVQAAVVAPWRAQYIGTWGHPRSQVMMAFERL